MQNHPRSSCGDLGRDGVSAQTLEIRTGYIIVQLNHKVSNANRRSGTSVRGYSATRGATGASKTRLSSAAGPSRTTRAARELLQGMPRERRTCKAAARKETRIIYAALKDGRPYRTRRRSPGRSHFPPPSAAGRPRCPGLCKKNRGLLINPLDGDVGTPSPFGRRRHVRIPSRALPNTHARYCFYLKTGKLNRFF